MYIISEFLFYFVQNVPRVVVVAAVRQSCIFVSRLFELFACVCAISNNCIFIQKLLCLRKLSDSFSNKLDSHKICLLIYTQKNNQSPVLIIYFTKQKNNDEW